MVCEHFYSHFQWITQFMCIFVLMFVFMYTFTFVCMAFFPLCISYTNKYIFLSSVCPRDDFPSHSLLPFGNTLPFYYRQNFIRLLAKRKPASEQASKIICRRECHVLCVADVVLIVWVCICGPMLSVDEHQESFACWWLRHFTVRSHRFLISHITSAQTSNYH